MKKPTLTNWSCSVILILSFTVVHCFGGKAQRNSVKKLDTPYVTLYANEYHRGENHLEFVKGCKNLPEQYDNWASSVNTHNRCIDVFEMKDCEGKSARIYPTSGVNTDVGLRLSLVGMNDQISSFKSCYTLMRKG